MTNTTLWARFYAGMGWQPLPSRPIEGRPVSILPSYAAYRDGLAIPGAWLDHWPAPLIQLALGAIWGLVVVDVDGPQALRTWNDWHLRGRCWPETWTVRTRAGLHFYYLLPPGTKSCPSRQVWKGDDAHSEIRVLGDGCLVTAPPSVHPKDQATRYAFLPWRWPGDLAIATAPAWILGLPPWQRSWSRRPAHGAGPAPCAPPDLGGNYPTLAAIPPRIKLDLARSWGVRFFRNRECPNQKGWIACHAIDREDRHPSASFHPASGMFWECGRRTECFAGLAVRLGVYPDLRSAFRGLGVGDGARMGSRVHRAAATQG